MDRPKRKYIVQAEHRYPIWLCPDCGWGITSNQWRTHRRKCTGHDRCQACDTPYPCRNTLCPKRERPNRKAIPNEVPGLAPRDTLCHSLGIEAVRKEDKTWKARRWGGDWVDGPSWAEAFHKLPPRT